MSLSCGGKDVLSLEKDSTLILGFLLYSFIISYSWILQIISRITYMFIVGEYGTYWVFVTRINSVKAFIDKTRGVVLDFPYKTTFFLVSGKSFCRVFQ